MIRIIERYIAKNLFVATALASLIILSVLMLILLLNEGKHIGEGDYHLLEAFIFVLMRLPGEFYRFSPMLILLGAIIGLSLMSNSRELAIMRASGFSITAIIASVLLTSLLMVAGTVFIGEGIAPDLTRKAELRKENLRNGGQAVVTTSGAWLHIDHNFIHIQRALGKQKLEGVTRYQFDDQNHLQATYYAKSMRFQNQQWQVYDGVKTVFNGESAVSSTFKNESWQLSFNPGFLKFNALEPFEMSLSKLARYAAYLKKNHLQASLYQYEFWQRVMQPFTALVMVLLAVPFVFGTIKSAMGYRILLGIMTGFLFYMSNAFLGQLCVVYQIPPGLAAATPLLVFTIIGIVLCKKIITN